MTDNIQPNSIQPNSMQPNTGTIRMYSTPEGADVHIDGNPLRYTSGDMAKTPLILTYVNAWPHWVIFKMHGYFDEIKLVGVIEGRTSDVYAIMRPI